MTLPLLVTFALLTAAFSTGSPVFLTPAVLILLLCASSVLGVWRASRTLEVDSGLNGHVVQRGEDVTLTISVSWRGLIPIAPLQVEVAAGPDQLEQTLRLEESAGRFRRLLAAINDGTLLHSPRAVSWFCTGCGALHHGCDAPEGCESCGRSRGHFIRSDFYPLARSDVR